MTEEQAKDTSCGFVALIGAPNSGKSTLINALVGAKVAIVTQKAQTTRGPVLGIAIEDKSQIVLIDTPGIFQPKRRLDRAMGTAAWARAGDADLVALVVDSERGLEKGALDSWLDPVLAELPNLKRPVIAVLNKIDLVPRPGLLELAAALAERHDFARMFMISALNGDGVQDLKTYLAQAVPPGPWLYPEDQLTDAPLRQAAAEITREKLFLRLHDELPYNLTVETDQWK
jgi:GTP-binding protein Era